MQAERDAVEVEGEASVREVWDLQQAAESTRADIRRVVQKARQRPWLCICSLPALGSLREVRSSSSQRKRPLGSGGGVEGSSRGYFYM